MSRVRNVSYVPKDGRRYAPPFLSGKEYWSLPMNDSESGAASGSAEDDTEGNSTVCAWRHVRLKVDSCVNVPRCAIETVLPFTDLFLLDLKAFASNLHRKLTGAPNERILENIRFIAEAGKTIEIRIPLVPGHNDSAENLAETAKFLSSLPVVPPVRLLPYHALARSKYEAVGRPDTMPHVPSPGRIELQKAAALMKVNGAETVIIHGEKY